MNRFNIVLSLTFMVVAGTGDCPTLLAKEVVFQSGSSRFKGHLAVPNGVGPFPAVIFLHGGMGPPAVAQMAAVQRLVEVLAQAGFVGFAPIRRQDPFLAGNVQDVITAIDYVKNVNAKRLAIIGFSRGGLLAFMSSTRRSDLKAVVLMAPAHGRGALRRFLADARNVTAPTLILVARNDTKQADHVRISRQINATLKETGKESRLIVYPPYQRDGHRLFFKVRQNYWQDVEKFLKNHLGG